MRFNLDKFPINNRYMLFGPPGIGKSTTINWLRKAGFKVLDLENIPASEWEHAINTTDAQFIGAAGVHPSCDLPKGMFKVLLWTTQELYDKRRAGRDKMFPAKAAQRHHTIAEWKSFRWDVKVKNSCGDYDTRDTKLSKFLIRLQVFELNSDTQ